MNLKAAKEIHRLIYDATTRSIPNFGGTYGFKVSPVSNPESLLRASSIFVGQIISGADPSNDQIESLRGECRIAEATGVLAENDMDKINQLLNELQDI